MDLNKFVMAALDVGSKTFIVHVAIQKWEKMAINPNKKPQIKAQSKDQSKAQVGALIFDKAPTEVLVKYSNYNNVFSVENIIELPENTGMN